MRETMPKVEILKIELIQNLMLWDRYWGFKESLKDKSESPNTKLIWHGTG
jgi:hypothetical protein